MEDHRKTVESPANAFVFSKNDTTSSTVANSPLFKLCPELRNMIYRFALITIDPVRITKSDGIPEPGLLIVNKIIRNETFAIFYQENRFQCEVYNYDDAALQLAVRKQDYAFSQYSLNIDRSTWLVSFLARPRNWKNLESWLHSCQQGRSAGLSTAGTGTAEDKLIDGLFAVVFRKPFLTAPGLDSLLKAMRPVLEALHVDWGKD